MADIAHHDNHHAPAHAPGQEYQDSGLAQPYHLVRPSPWPLMGAMSGGLLHTPADPPPVPSRGMLSRSTGSAAIWP